MTPSHWRIAAGSCLLAAGMVMTAGGATAFADTGSSASDRTTTSTQDSARPHGLFSGTLRHTLRDVTSTFGVRGQRLTQLLTDQRGLATKSVLDTVSFGLDATTRITRTVTGVLPAQPPTSPIEAATPSPAGIVPTAAAVVPDVTPVSDPLTTTVDQVASGSGARDHHCAHHGAGRRGSGHDRRRRPARSHGSRLPSSRRFPS